MSRDRSTLVIIVANNVYILRWPAKRLYLNPIDHWLDLLQRKVRAQPLQLYLKEFTCVMFAAIPQQYIRSFSINILSISTRCNLAVDATPG